MPIDQESPGEELDLTASSSVKSDDLLSSSASSERLKSPASFRHILIGGCPVTVVPDGESVSSFVQRIALQRSFQEERNAFSVCDLGDVIRKYHTWTELLPGVTPFYAVKCNDDPVVLSVLARLGSSFDCASKKEIQKSMEWNDVTVSPQRILYAHPVKDPAYIRYASDKGIDLMTFDSEEELVKVKAIHRGADLIVRILVPWSSDTDGDMSEVSMEEKFGCDANEAVRLVQIAHGLGLRVVGVSFYAGHRCYNPVAYERAIEAAKFVFDSVLSVAGIELHVLDIGGGFYAEPSNCALPFTDAAKVIQSAIERYFGDQRSLGTLRVIAEPGQYLSGTSTRLAVSVIGVRRVVSTAPSASVSVSASASASASVSPSSASASASASSPSSEKPRYHYFINDGCYGSFRYYKPYNERRSVPLVPVRLPNPRRIPGADAAADVIATSTNVVENGGGNREEVYDSVLWGPTCDSLDVVDVCRIERLELGDWLVFDNMGFYTSSCSTRFNGMPVPSKLHVVEEKYVDALLAGFDA